MLFKSRDYYFLVKGLMLNKRTQIVIGIAVLIISAAFLLVGIEFAQLQGLLFQNGANSLQLFANNIAAVQNSLYLAPDSMQISIAGNNSLCTWSPAIDAYSCGGGSKIENVSYAAGPTLDAGQNTFSAALCFMVGLGPKVPTSAAKDAASAASDAGEFTSSAVSNAGEFTSSAPEGIFSSTAEGTFSSTAEGVFSSTAEGTFSSTNPGVLASSTQATSAVLAEDGASKVAEEAAVVDQAATEGASIVEAQDGVVSQAQAPSELSRTPLNLKTVFTFFKNHPIVTNLVFNIVEPVAVFYFGAELPNIVSALQTVYNYGQDSVSALHGTTMAVVNVVLSAYDTAAPISPQYAAFNLELQRYSQTVLSLNELNSLQPSIATYNTIHDVVSETNVQQDQLNQLAGYLSSTTQTAFPYSAPTAGVSVPSSIGSPNSFIGPASFSGPGDPILGYAAFFVEDSFLVYARTASCLGSLPSGVSIHEPASDQLSQMASSIGALTSLINVYVKLNLVTQIGTYFIGYGGEIYVNGQSSGRPTIAGAPVISDLSDLCSIAQSAAEPGYTLKTLIFPAGNGSLSFSINQGLYNTMCSPQDQLYPKTLGAFVNQALNLKAGESKNISILLPPQYALGISNSSGENTLCIFRLFTDGYGSPIMTKGNYIYNTYGPSFGLMPKYFSAITEYGLPVSCINLMNITNSAETINFTSTWNYSKAGFYIPNATWPTIRISDALAKVYPAYAFFINNASELGFSIPLGVYSNPTQPQALNPIFQSTANFIGGPGIQSSIIPGIDSPVVNFLAGAVQKQAPRLQASFSNTLVNFVLNAITGSIGDSSLDYYPTTYTNVTFQITKGSPVTVVYGVSTTPLAMKFESDTLLFGVSPYTYNNFDGSYITKTLGLASYGFPGIG